MHCILRRKPLSLISVGKKNENKKEKTLAYLHTEA
jgi:hypothetical protein